MTKNEDSARKPRAFQVNGQDSETSAPDRKPRASGSKARRKPKAIDLKEKRAEITHLPDAAVDAAYERLAETGAASQEIRALESLEPAPAPASRKRHGFGWGKLAFAAFSLLAGLALSLALDAFIRDLFARNDWLGYAGLALASLFVIGIAGLVLREAAGMWRLSTIDGLRSDAERARSDNNLKLARKVAERASGLFAGRPETARGRAALAGHADAVMDGIDAIALLERDLLAPLDRAGRAMVLGSAKRVSVVTAVSPRALVDVGFVLFENIRLIRRIGEHYGGKPGLAGSIRLVRQVVFHLGATGAIAVGDGLVQQLVGHGLAARLSARLGEGVVNGLLTARIGIAAMDVCRPVPFEAGKRPRITDFMPELIRLQGADKADKPG